MHLTNTWRRGLLLSGLFVSSGICAPSPGEEIAPLPITLSAEQLHCLLPLSLAASEAPQPSGRLRLRKPGQLLSPEQLTYKLTVQKLGINPHRFVHCNLPKGKVRTGVILNVGEYGFVLKDGIFAEQWIPYSDLQAQPRPVAAVGTRVAQGFKWVGVALGVAVLIPFLPLFWSGGC